MGEGLILVAPNNVILLRVSKGRDLHSDEITEVKAKSKMHHGCFKKICLYFISYMVRVNSFVGNDYKAVISSSSILKERHSLWPQKTPVSRKLYNYSEATFRPPVKERLVEFSL